jgi:hypothetical protein
MLYCYCTRVNLSTWCYYTATVHVSTSRRGVFILLLYTC